MKRRAKQPVGSAPGPAAGPAGRMPSDVANARMVPVVLVWSLADRVLTVTATTPWRGAVCRDSWSISPSLDLVATTGTAATAPLTPGYVARASVAESSLAPDTTYTFSYAIVMRTGDSTWAGGSSVTVTVGSDRSLSRSPLNDRRPRP